MTFTRPTAHLTFTLTSPNHTTDRLHASGELSEAPLPLPQSITDGELSSLKAKEFDLLIVGAGLSGATLAERCSKQLNMRCLVIDKRNHLGGNCYDYVTEHGIRASKYGAHLFHTEHDRVWNYVKTFSEWIPFDHRVKGLVKDELGNEKFVPIPPTQETVNLLFPQSNENEIKTEQDMERWYEQQRVVPMDAQNNPRAPLNGEEAALSRVGPNLYDKIFKHYTKKQWDKYPEELDASVLLRLPCRTTTDDRYFGDKYQALPKRGYTRIFENMLLGDGNISVKLNCDYFSHKAEGTLPKHKLLVYTGQIDLYYASMGMPKLEYRSLRFQEEYVEWDEGEVEKDASDASSSKDAAKEPSTSDNYFYQPAMVVNYPGPDVPFTRIVEYKHTPNQPRGIIDEKTRGTLIAKEFSTDEGEPYYPVPNPENRALYEKYKKLGDGEKNVSFVGRLASYKYFNMDQAVLNALEMFDNLQENGVLEEKRAPEEFGEGDGMK